MKKIFKLLFFKKLTALFLVSLVLNNSTNIATFNCSDDYNIGIELCSDLDDKEEKTD